VLDDGRRVTAQLVHAVIDEELKKIRADLGDEAFGQGKFPEARAVFESVATGEPVAEFLTLPAYDLLD
jgi:malate synthase